LPVGVQPFRIMLEAVAKQAIFSVSSESTVVKGRRASAVAA